MLDDCLELKELIEKETGFALTFEGIHKWIAFVHAKQNDVLPVPNRYFGVYEDDTVKVRGIEARRHDTPEFFCKFQYEDLEIMSKGNNINEVKSLLPKVVDIYHKYVQLLKENKIPIDQLAFTKRLSKDSNKYQKRNTIESNALTKLKAKESTLKLERFCNMLLQTTIRKLDLKTTGQFLWN